MNAHTTCWYAHPAGQVMLLLALTCLLLLPGNHVLPLIDRDEPRFAQASVEMADQGNWIVPYFNGTYRFDKPVLTYWVMNAGYALFGRNEFGARFHAAFFAALTALVIYGMGRRWYSPAVGLLGGFAWLTSLQVLIHGRSAVADQPMIFFVALSQWALFELLVSERPGQGRPWFWVAYISLGFGFLAKGPVAVLVPALGLVLHRVIHGKPEPWRRLRLLRGLMVFLIITGSWGIPALIQTGGAFWDVGMNKHVIERGMEAFNGRIFLPVLYYPVTALISLFPWIVFSGPVLACAYATRRDRRSSFLIAWFLAPVLVFSFYATQLPHYIMPGFPAFALLTGVVLSGAKPWAGWHRRMFYIALVPVSLLLIVALATSLYWPLPVLSVLRWAMAGLALLLTGLLALAVCARAGWWRMACASLMLLAAGPVLFGYGLRPASIALQVREPLKALPPDAAVAASRFLEPSLVYYTNRRWTMLRDANHVIDWNREHAGRPRAVTTLDREAKLDAFFRGGRRIPLEQAGKFFPEEQAALERAGYRRVLTVEGFNTARSTWVVVSVWLAGD